MTGVTVRAPAKINLQLAVGPRRTDGYHDLVTVFQAISLHDDVTAARPAARAGTGYWSAVRAPTRCPPAPATWR